MKSFRLLLLAALSWSAPISQTVLAQGLTTLAVSSGESHSLALRSDGTVWSWGYNSNGQLAAPTSLANSPVPVRVAGLTNAIAVAAGRSHSLAVLADGRIAAWGKGTDGQLGNGASADKTNVVYVSTISNAVAVAAGDQHSLALLADGRVMAWGKNSDQPRLGNGTSTDSNVPVQVVASNLGSVIAVAAGWNCSFALRSDRTVWAWGGGAAYLLGIPGLTSTNAPAQVAGLSNVVSLAAAEFHTLAGLDDGTVAAWGTNNVNQLGTSSTTNVAPAVVANVGNVVAVAAGKYCSLVLRADGTVYNWGYIPAYSGFGSGSPTPQPVTGLPSCKTISQGYDFLSAVATDGAIYSWGVNDKGQLGNGGVAGDTHAVVTGRRFGPVPMQASGRFIRGVADIPTDTAFVLPLNQQQGVPLKPTGGDFYEFGPSVPWFSQIQSDLRQQFTLAAVGSTTPSRMTVQNPVAAFGTPLGGTPLYPNTGYGFGVYAGGLDEATSDPNAPNVLRILAFDRSQFTSGASGLTTTNVILVTLPRRTVTGDSNAWINFASNSFRLTINSTNVGLSTTVEFVDADSFDAWGLGWYAGSASITNSFTLAGYKVTHRATTAATNYHFVVESLGSVQTNASNLVRFSTNSSGAWAYTPMYSLDFSPTPAKQAVVLTEASFAAQPLPPDYAGKSLAERNGLLVNITNLPALWITNNAAYTNLDNSPELHQHPLLDQVVKDLNKDPLAIASFVINEIELSDPIGVTGTGSYDQQSVGLAGVSRGALGTLLERQGSPVEQCALLVYLLRSAGYPAAFMWPTNSNLQLLDTRLSSLLQMQVRGVKKSDGQPYLSGSLITVNYPWVLLNLGNNRSIQIFPWLKDTEIVEGLNLYDYLPEQYNSGFKWVHDYIFANTNLLNLDPENNTPLALFPKFVTAQLATNAPGLSLDDFGVKVTNRRHQYVRWEDLPTPNVLTNDSSVPIIPNLTASGYSFLNNIFDTFELQVYLADHTTFMGYTGPLRMADLNNRRFLIKSSYDGYGNSFINIDLEAFRPSITTSNWLSMGVDATLLNRGYQNLSTGTLYPNGYVVRLICHRHIQASGNGWAGFLGTVEGDDFSDDRPLAQTELAAVVFNLGRVTPQMLKVHADDYLRVEQWRAATNTYVPGWTENDGNAAYLLGMGYFERESRFFRQASDLHKVHTLSRYDAGLAKLGSRKLAGVAKTQAGLDMPHYFSVTTVNNTSHPDSAEPNATAWEDFWWLLAANSSAEEHQTINSMLHEQTSISTVRLLQLAQQRALAAGSGVAGIVELNRKNYQSLGTNIFTGWQGVKLKDVDTNLWTSISNAFDPSQHWDADYAKAYVTPGKVTNEVVSYIGMGALIVSLDGSAGLIGGDSSPNNGGFGGFLNFFGYDTSWTPSYPPWTINENSYGTYSFHDNKTDVAYNLQSFTPVDVLGFDSNSYNSFSQSARDLSSQISLWGGGTAASTTPIVSSVDRGFPGPPVFVTGEGTTVADPVNVITGEFYHDAVDLTLPGPFPLRLRRNYLSQNLADNLFGHGWKISLMPYLFCSTNTNNVVMLLAANMEGSVVAYRQQSNTNLYLPDLRDNPLLNNYSEDGIGSTRNWFNSRIDRTFTGGVAYYKLSQPDGGARYYHERTDFAVAGSGGATLGRVRPYLDRWEDNRGNYHLFTFGTTSTATDYGQVSRIDSSNGNGLAFKYDGYGHIVEASTVDGRRVQYEYDTYGDLTKVTLPDASEVRYDYQHTHNTYSLAGDFTTNQPANPLWQYEFSWWPYFATPCTLPFCRPGSQWTNNNVPANTMFWGYTSNSCASGGPYDTNCLVGPGIFRCGPTGYAPQTTFMVPHAGTVNISGDVTGPGGSSDGVQIRISGKTVRYSQQLPGSDSDGWVTVARNATLRIKLYGLSVAADEMIHFQVWRSNDSIDDYVLWNPQVTYSDGSAYDSSHLLTVESKPDGRILQNVYDSKRRVTAQLATVGPDMRLYTNALFAYTQTVDDTNSVTSTLTGNTVVTDIRNNSITYQFSHSVITSTTDAVGSVQQEWYADTDTVPGYKRSLKRRTDKRGLTTEFQYDASGNVTKTSIYCTNALGNLMASITGDATDGITNAVTTSTYDANNLPLTTTDAVGNKVQYIYSGTYPFLPDKVVRLAGSSPISTNSYTYYNTNVISSDGVNSFTNAAYGLLFREIVGGAVTNEWRHSGMGYVLQEMHYPTAVDFTSADPVITNTFTYGLRGELIARIDPKGRASRFDYDALGRLNAHEVFDENGVPLSREYTYHNGNGDVTWYDGPQSYPEDYVWHDYDGAGRLSSEVHWRSRAVSNGTGVEAESGDNLYSQTFHYYDGFGNRTNTTDSLGNYTEMAYDALGQLTNQVTFDVRSGAAIALTTNRFTYEPGGECEIVFNPLGGATTSIYTVSGKLARRQNADGSVNSWTYYADGRLRKEVLANGSYWLTTYDDFHRQVSRTFYNVGNTQLATTSKTFDTRGNVVSETDANGQAFSNQYDGLNRLKVSTGPVFNAANQRQQSTYAYDNAGALTTVSNALGEATSIAKDALGRVTTTAIVDASGATNHLTRTFYSTNNNCVITIAGTGASAITNTVYSDTSGQAVLKLFAVPGQYQLDTYDRLGNLATHRDELAQTTAYQYDALHRRTRTTLPDSAVNSFTYDPAGNVTTNAMPGGMTARALYDTAGRLRTNWLANATGTITRGFTNTYYTNGPVGQLLTVTDGRNLTRTLQYDDWMRVKSNFWSSLVLTYTYDNLGRPTELKQIAGSQTTQLQRSYDPYGQITEEAVLLNGSVFSDFAQVWNVAGRRSERFQNTPALTQGPGFGDDTLFTWRADGMPAAVAQSGVSANYGYADNGLLTGRTNSWRQWTVNQRDARGRLKQVTTQVGGSPVFTEYLGWRANSTLNTYNIDRSGGGAWDESRAYGYNSRGQLTQETFVPSGYSTTAYAYGYDAAKLGVRTSATLSGSLANGWTASTPDGFGRLTGESLSLSLWYLTAQGRAPGALSVGLTLDGWVVTPVTYNAANPDGSWQAPMSAATGSHTLIATAVNPFNGGTGGTNYVVKTTNTFTTSGSSTVSVGYDGNGNVTTRTFSGGRTQSLVWDELGRLTQLTETLSGTTNLVWTAAYDGMSRRYRVTETRYTGGVAQAPAVIDSWYDPQVEFLEVAVSYNGERWWNVHGPDLDGAYGSLQGVGGLEGAIRERDGATEGLLGDNFGNGIATVAKGTVMWNSTPVTAYGAPLGYEAPRLSYNVSPMQAVLLRGRRTDMTGLIQFGLRPYDPTEGRFVSPDSLGHSGSWSLYDYANNDPVNGLDPDGRVAKRIGQGLAKGVDGIWNLGVAIAFTPDNGGLTSEDRARLGRLAVETYGSPLLGLHAYDATPENAVLTREIPAVLGGPGQDVLLALAVRPGAQSFDEVRDVERERINNIKLDTAGADVPARSFSAKEQRIADYLENTFGSKVTPNPEEGRDGAGRQGDAYVDGVKTEFKSLDPGATPNTIKNQVNNSIKGGGQAREIMIDARGSGLTKDLAEQGTFKALGISRDKVDGISVIGDDFFLRITPIKK